MRLGYIAIAAFAAILAAPASLPGAIPPATDDPLLQPLVDDIRSEPGQPLPASEELLKQLLALSATDSSIMRQQMYSVAQVDAARFRSWLYNLPVLSASYSLGAYYLNNNSISGSQSFSPGGALALVASRELISWGAFDATRDLGELKEEIAQNEALLAYAKLCLDVRKSYYNLIKQKAQLDLLSSQVATARHKLEKEQLLFKSEHSTAGNVTALDLAVQNLEVSQNTAEAALHTQLKDFLRQTGSKSFTIADIPDRIYLPVIDQHDLQVQSEDFQKNGFDKSLTNREAVLNENAIDKQIVINDANRKPQLSAAASVSEGPYANGNSLTFSTIFFVGVSGSWTIFDRNESISATRALMAQRHLAEAKLDDAHDQALNDVSNSLSQIDLGLRSLAIRNHQYTQQQDEYRRIQVLLGTGHAEQTDLDDIRDSLLNLKFQILSSRIDVADGYYSFISDIFRDPALLNAPSYTQPRGP